MNKLSIWRKKPVAVDEAVVIKENIKAFSNPDYWFDVWFMKLLGSKGATKGVTIARRMGVSKSRVSDIVNDEADVQVSTLIKFALAVGFIPHLVMEPVEEYAKRVHKNSPMTVDRSDNIMPPIPRAVVTDRSGAPWSITSHGDSVIVAARGPYVVPEEADSQSFVIDNSTFAIGTYEHN